MNPKKQPSEVFSILERELANFESVATLEEVGTVLEVGDSIALVYGLQNVKVGELVVFDSGVEGIAFNLEASHVGVVLLDNNHNIREGEQVKRTQKVVSIPVGEGFLGRVINPLGLPMDGKGPIEGALLDLEIERKSPEVLFRAPVSEPLQTGILKIDTMIPIGRGQRQLIIGDRQTGKTTIAIDTILNQREGFEQGDPVYCILVFIGQKASTIAKVVGLLEEHGAMEYTVVIACTASQPAALQFLAPFAGTTIGEYFRDTGRHALVVFDDLSKHAVYYRELSLLLKRFPGREAYPGDVFYLHARLLERAAKIINNDEMARQMNNLPAVLKDKVRGGGSLTALPIIESQEGDVSAYIPTNVISITDGQIFLETALFNTGDRPAINVGISVSRVGGNAQLSAMKKVAGTLKLEQAQFLELESFSKFGGELSLTTQRIIDRGRKNRALLNQPAHQPLRVEDQIVLTYASVHGFLDDIPIEKIKLFAERYITSMYEEHADTLAEIRTGELNSAHEKILDAVAGELVKQIT